MPHSAKPMLDSLFVGSGGESGRLCSTEFGSCAWEAAIRGTEIPLRRDLYNRRGAETFVQVQARREPVWFDVEGATGF